MFTRLPFARIRSIRDREISIVCPGAYNSLDGMLNHARESDSTSLVSPHVARRRTKARIEPGASELPRGSRDRHHRRVPRLSRRSSFRSDILLRCSSQLSELLTPASRPVSRRGSTPRSPSREIPGLLRDRRVSLRLGILRNLPLGRFPHETLHLRTYALPPSLARSLAFSVFFVSQVPGLRHTQLCRALFLTLLRHDGAQTTTLIGAARCMCAPRERHNVSNPRPNRESD